MKKLICLLTAAIMLLVSVSAIAEAPAENNAPTYKRGSKLTADEFVIVAENDNIALSVNGKNAVFTLTNKATGKVWRSNPELTEEEIDAVKLGLGKVNSQICISYLTEERTDGTVNGNTAKTTVEEYIVDGKCIGFVTTYNFDKSVILIKIPIAYTITETGMKAEILYDEIEENGTSQLSSIELLPMFGAAKAKDNGYLFIPDGSGAIVNYNTINDSFPDYQETVYGSDSSVSLKLRMLPASEGVKMPVFGAKIDDEAYFAVISSGDSVAKINATASASAYNVASVWPSFYYREFDEVGIMSKDSMSRAVRMLDKNISTENPVVEYNLLSGDDANYSGMARFYRDYLVKQYDLEKLGNSAVAPVIQSFGKTYSDETFFGIPVKKALAATTTEDLERFYNSLNDKGVNDAKFFLYGFQKGGYQNKYLFKYSVDGKVGGKRGIKSLVETVGSGNVYMAYDLLHDYNFGGLFSDSKYVAAMNKVTIIKQNGLLSTGAWKGTLSWKLISNKALNKFGEKLVKSFDKDLGVGIVFENMGGELYNDFDEKYAADRAEFKTTYQNINNAAAEKGIDVGTDGSNIYLIGSADIITEVPLYSSDKLMFTDHVPFYAMVTHGYTGISSKPFNNAADTKEYAAVCAQFGIMPTYRITAADSNSLQDSNLSFLFNSEFSAWENIIAENNKMINDVSEGLGDKLITAHEYVGELSVVKYENGVTVVYNRSNTETIEFEGKQIAPKSVVRI